MRTFDLHWKEPGRYVADDCDVSEFVGCPATVEGQPKGRIIAARPKDGGVLVTVEVEDLAPIVSAEEMDAALGSAFGGQYSIGREV